MKNFDLSAVRWVSRQARPFLPPFVFILILRVSLSLCGVGVAIMSKVLIDAAVERQGGNAAKAALLFAFLIFLLNFLQAVVSVKSAKTSESLSNSIRQQLFTRLSRAYWTDFSTYHTGDVLTRMTSDVGIVAAGLVNVLPGIVSLGTGLAGAFTALLAFEPVLAFLAFFLGPASMLFSRFFSRRLKKLHLAMQEKESAYRSFLQEALQNMLVIKTFCLEQASGLRLGKLQKERLDWVVRRSRMNSAAGSALSLGYWLGYFLAFGWGALRLSAGAVTFGTFAAFIQLVEQIQSPFAGLAYTLPQLAAALASAERLMELDDLSSEDPGKEKHSEGRHSEGKHSEEKQCGELANGCPVCQQVGILIEGVYYSYDEEKPVLVNVTGGINPGEITALIGTSGEGKTTMVRLLLSLIRPVSGHIYLTMENGSKTEISASSRRLISYVPQGNTLFSGTIAENLRMGCPEAEDAELVSALQSACAWEFVERLPDGLATKIGEKGLGLSEGQAQRLAIARALLRKAPVLILDEATSALDAQTERCILNTIQGLSPACTCFIVTHRATALSVCHRVFKLENGYFQETFSAIDADQGRKAV